MPPTPRKPCIIPPKPNKQKCDGNKIRSFIHSIDNKLLSATYFRPCNIFKGE